MSNTLAPSRLKKDLVARRLTIGSWLSLSSLATTEMMAQAGFQWLVIDMEHTPTSFEHAQQMLHVMKGYPCEPVVRVGANDPLLIKKSLDLGAHGVIVPMINNAREAEKAVGAALYPPAGFRGAGLFRAQGYGADFESYSSWAKENISVVVQIEHVQAVKNLDEILSVPGVDGFMLGPYDLSASLGLPGDFENPKVQKVLNEVATRVRGGSPCAGYHIVHGNPQELRTRVEEGYRMIAYGDDMVFLKETLSEVKKSLKDVTP